MHRVTSDNASRLWVVIVTLLLTVTSGCAESDNEQPIADQETSAPFAFCDQVIAYYQSGSQISSISGCPQELLFTTEGADASLAVPANATGLGFIFESSMVQPHAKAVIEVWRDEKRIGERSLTFLAGSPLGESGGDPDPGDATRQFKTTFSTCNATHVAFRWEQTVPMGTAEVVAYVDSDKATSVATGKAMCNQYWS